MDANNERPAVLVKWGHLILVLVVYLLSIGVIYGTLRTQMEETSRRLENVESNKVDQRQFDEFKEDIIRRLQRIEDKIDRERRGE